MARGLLTDTAPAVAERSSSSEKQSSDSLTGDLYRNVMRLVLRAAAEAAYKQHRLRYVHKEDDGELTYVCVCGDGWTDRRKWNAHITESFSEVIE